MVYKELTEEEQVANDILTFLDDQYDEEELMNQFLGLYDQDSPAEASTSALASGGQSAVHQQADTQPQPQPQPDDADSGADAEGEDDTDMWTPQEVQELNFEPDPSMMEEMAKYEADIAQAVAMGIGHVPGPDPVYPDDTPQQPETLGPDNDLHRSRRLARHRKRSPFL